MQSSSKEPWGESAELCFKILYGLPADLQIRLACFMMRRYLPIFEFKNHRVKWPRRLLNDVLLILHPEEGSEQIPTWIERKGSSFREYKNTLFFALADPAGFAHLREDVKTSLALHEIKKEIEQEPDSPLAASLSDIKQRIHKIEREYSYNVRRMYDTIQVGTRQLSLGKPISGNENLTRWYWQELTNRELIVQKLHYRILLRRIMRDHHQLATRLILDQFYKNTRLPTPASPEVVARAIQLGIQDGAFGLAILNENQQPIPAKQLRYQQEIPLAAISFTEGIYLISKSTCHAILAEEKRRQEEEAARQRAEKEANPFDGKQSASSENKEPNKSHKAAPTSPTPPSPPAKARGSGKKNKYKRLRLVVSDIPASRLIDINRGIFMPLSHSTDGQLKFTLELDVTSTEGISRDTLETKIKETIRQIGAKIAEEEVE